MKKINWHKVILYATIIILAIFLFKTCRKPIAAPVVIKEKEMIRDIAAVDAAKKQLSDSFTVVFRQQEQVIAYKESMYDDLMATYLNEVNDLQNTFLLPVPDTCKKIVGQLNYQFNQLKQTSDRKDNSARQVINSLKDQNKTKDNFLLAKDRDYQKLHSVLDTCVKTVKALEDYSKKLQPKTSLFVSVTGLGNQNNFGYGVGLGIMNKRGTAYEVGAFQYAGAINYSLSIKKTIFRW